MKNYLEIYQKPGINYGNIIEFCQSGKVGTLQIMKEITIRKANATWKVALFSPYKIKRNCIYKVS